ncbi:MAG: pyruvate kinase alpha/beta domain-containing protein [Nitrospirota bacterium]
MERKVIYFEKVGAENTNSCLEIAKNAIRLEGYKHIVIASTTGKTGILFSEALKGLTVNTVIVTHSSGFKEPNTIEMSDNVRKIIESHGAKVYTGTMLTHSLETALMEKFKGIYVTPAIIIANALRRFGEGPKVCCEIVMMAVDAGLIPEGEKVLAVAGTAMGADTVTVIKSAASKRFLDLRVLEILAKPGC